MTSQWARSEQVAWEELDGELLLVQAGTRRMWRLNAAAAAIWRACTGRVNACDGKALRLSSECAAFCRRLERKGLLTEIGAPALQYAGPALRSGGPLPQMQELSFGSGPRHRPSPRGLSGGPG